MIKLIKHNPYRTLGVLSNTPLRERIANQNKLNAFAKIGKSVIFLYDFDGIIEEVPLRTPENIAAAITAINLDSNQLKHSLFWFINASPIDGIALKYLQSKDIIKAKELFQKRESFSSLINLGVLAFIEGNFAEGYANISKVIHNESYRTDLLETLSLQNITLSENEIAEMLSAVNNPSDKEIISEKAVNEPIAEINTAISAAKSVNSKDANANLTAGTVLMNSTKTALKQVRDIVGATSTKYQMVADNLAKQILQCGINYYNNASDDDVESPRKAMSLQAYALQIAIGKLTKDRCQENYDILKKTVDNMPPAEVAIETRKIKEELRKFCQQPDKISHSITLLNLDDEHSPAKIIDSKVRPVLREAWKATTIMDGFDMESDFRTKRYIPNRNSLKDMCETLHISTSSSSYQSSSRASTTTTRTTTPPRTTPPSSSTSSSDDGLPVGCWVVIIIAIIIFLANVLG